VLDSVLRDLVEYVREFITSGNAGRENISEWAKKPAAWTALLASYNRRSSPVSSTRLDRAGWLRPFRESSRQAASRAVEVLRGSPRPLAKGELLSALGATDSDWPNIRMLLLETQGVVQKGEKSAARYSFSEQNI
jgi:hypothetical protein